MLTFDPASVLPLLPPRLEAAPKDLFIYGCEFLPLAASAVRQQASFRVRDDAAFLIVAANALVTTAADSTVADADSRPLLAQIRRLSSGYPISGASWSPGQSAQVAFSSLFGTGRQWAYWPMTYILRPYETLQVELTNLEAVARNIRLSFIGIDLFTSSAADSFAYFRGNW